MFVAAKFLLACAICSVLFLQSNSQPLNKRDVDEVIKDEPGGGVGLGLALPQLPNIKDELPALSLGRKRRSITGNETNEPGGAVNLGLGLPQLPTLTQELPALSLGRKRRQIQSLPKPISDGVSSLSSTLQQVPVIRQLPGIAPANPPVNAPVNVPVNAPVDAPVNAARKRRASAGVLGGLTDALPLKLR